MSDIPDPRTDRLATKQDLLDLEALSTYLDAKFDGERDALSALQKRINTVEDRVADRTPDAGEPNAMARFFGIRGDVGGALGRAR